MITLSNDEQATLKQILKSQGVGWPYKVLIFGSRTTGKARKYSDIDLALVGPTSVPFRMRGLLAEALEESNLPYTVDIVDFLTASERMKQAIQQDGVELSLA